MKKQSFAAGAVILMISNTVSKILGAVFKIPLTYIIGEEGMAVYNTAFSVYIMFLSFIISGLPFAVSKLVSEYSSSRLPGMAQYTVKFANLLLFAAGTAGSLMLFFGADFFALAVKEEKAVLAIKLIAPSVFFVAAGTTARSYFQGISNMIPTAASQIIEAVIKLAAGYAIALYLAPHGISAAAGGAVAGVAIGEAAASAVFLISYITSKTSAVPCRRAEKKQVRGALFEIAVPLLFSSVVASMLSVIDTSVIRSGLMDFGLAENEARRVYGAYTGYALTVLHLPIGILATLGVSILPVISGSLAVNNLNRARAAAASALRLSVILSLPCAVIVYFMSGELLEILFGNASSSAMLMLASPCIVTISCANIMIAVLQSAGKIVTVFVYSSLTALLKILLCAVLMPKFGIYGAVLSANICYFAEMLISAAVLKKIMGLKFGITETIIKPAAAGAVMPAVLLPVRQPIEYFIPQAIPRTAALCLFSLAAYAAALLLFYGSDIKQLFCLRTAKKGIEKRAAK